MEKSSCNSIFRLPSAARCRSYFGMSKLNERFEDWNPKSEQGLDPWAKPAHQAKKCGSSDCTTPVESGMDFCDECEDEMNMGVRSPTTGDPYTNYSPDIRKDLRARHFDHELDDMLPYLVLKDGTELFADLPAMALLDIDNQVYKQFDDEFTMTKFIRDNEDASVKAADQDDVGRHIFHWKSPVEPPQLSLEQRKAFEVFRDGDFAVLLLPADPQVLQREGVAMQHCLAYLHNDYAARQKTGEIVLYSLLDLRDNDPKVDIELAISRDSYRRNHDRPTIIQIRGKRNECPPKDEYILPIQRFFEAMGQGWNISDHNNPNFDGKVDGKLFKARVQALQQQESVTRSVDKVIGK